MGDTVTLETSGPKNNLLIPDYALCVHNHPNSLKTHPRPPTELGSPQGPAPLTGPKAEACATQLAIGQGPMVPQRELSTGLA